MTARTGPKISSLASGLVGGNIGEDVGGDVETFIGQWADVAGEGEPGVELCRVRWLRESLRGVGIDDRADAAGGVFGGSDLEAGGGFDQPAEERIVDAGQG